MAHKKLMFRAAARAKILDGVTALADAVRVTLGPKSKCVLIEKKWGKPIVCNDGVTIAKEFDLPDAEENLGVQMIREAAERTAAEVGDGTSTSTVLAQAIYADGLRNITAGASAIDVKRGLDRALGVAVQTLHSLSKPVESRREQAQVASISAHNDTVIGDMVADAMEKVGREGVITVEEAKNTETTLEVVEGMQFDQGFVSHYFVTDPAKSEAVLEEPLILLYEKKINQVQDMIPLLEQLAKGNHSLLIVAEDIDGEGLATLVLNKVRGVLSCIAVKAPGYGDRRKEMLQDLAILTGAKVVSPELGVDISNVKIEELGKAQRVVANKNNTTIIGGAGTEAAIKGRCDEVRQQLAGSTSEYERGKLEERLAKLSGGVAVIRVGAPSEVEMRNRKEALEDAISATKAAVAEGIVPGGGLALLRCMDTVEREAEKCVGDERTGVQILKRALEAPTRQIAENSAVDGGVVVGAMIGGSGNYGFDAGRGEYTDLMEAGIVDPTKVVRVALQNAVSVASVLLLTEATLTDIPEPKLESGAQYEAA